MARDAAPASDRSGNLLMMIVVRRRARKRWEVKETNKLLAREKPPIIISKFQILAICFDLC